MVVFSKIAKNFPYIFFHPKIPKVLRQHLIFKETYNFAERNLVGITLSFIRKVSFLDSPKGGQRFKFFSIKKTVGKLRGVVLKSGGGWGAHRLLLSLLNLSTVIFLCVSFAHQHYVYVSFLCFPGKT